LSNVKGLASRTIDKYLYFATRLLKFLFPFGPLDWSLATAYHCPGDGIMESKSTLLDQASNKQRLFPKTGAQALSIILDFS
jgi:hypothetical protein